VVGGEITKAACNWLGDTLDASHRSQIMSIDHDGILNLYTANNLPLPNASGPAVDPWSTSSDEPPF
jgi:hypothetical protein